MATLIQRLNGAYQEQSELAEDSSRLKRTSEEFSQTTRNLEQEAAGMIYQFADRNFQRVGKSFNEKTLLLPSYGTFKEFFYDTGNELGLVSKNLKQRQLSFDVWTEIDIETFRKYAKLGRTSYLFQKAGDISLLSIVGFPLSFPLWLTGILGYDTRRHKIWKQYYQSGKIKMDREATLYLLDNYDIG